MNIILFATEKSPASAVAGVIDTLNTAMQLAKLEGRIRLVSESGQQINCQNGVVLQPEGNIRQVYSGDLLIIGPLGKPPRDGFLFSEPLLTWIRQQQTNNTPIASTCTGAFLLAATGLLNYRNATTHWLYADQFQRQFPEVRLNISRKITDDAQLMCSGGANAYLDLCLYLTEKYLGRTISLRLAKMLLITPSADSQAAFITHQRHRLHQDDKIHLIQDLLDTTFTQNTKTAAMADKLGLSERHFKRRFKQATGESPLNYIQGLRIQLAKDQLESTLNSFESISYQVGYEDIHFFRKLFKRQTGLTPSQYRSRFGQDRN